jgi:glycosyltransferase involved in cell wall biosynthesis
MHIVHTYTKNMGIDVNNKNKFTFAERWGLVSQAKLGHKVTLICGGRVRKKKKYIWKGINVIELPIALEFTDTTRLIRGFFRELIHINADVFHTHHYCYLVPEITLLAAKLKRKPVFLTLHVAFNEQIGFMRMLERTYYILFQPSLYFYNRVFYISKYLTKKYLGFKKNKEIIYNYFRETPSIKIKRKENTIFFMGRLVHLKGLDIVIKAIDIVKEEIPNVKLNIFGKGEEEYKNKLKELIKKLKIEKNVHFCGLVYGKDKWKEYYSSTIQVVSSREEGFGNVVIEGMLCNVPMIVSNKGALWEASGKHALMFDIENPKNLAKNIIYLLKNKKNRSKMAKKAQKYAKNFLKDNIGKQTIKTYKQILNKY